MKRLIKIMAIAAGVAVAICFIGPNLIKELVLLYFMLNILYFLLRSLLEAALFIIKVLAVIWILTL